MSSPTSLTRLALGIIALGLAATACGSSSDTATTREGNEGRFWRGAQV